MKVFLFSSMLLFSNFSMAVLKPFKFNDLNDFLRQLILPLGTPISTHGNYWTVNNRTFEIILENNTYIATEIALPCQARSFGATSSLE